MAKRIKFNLGDVIVIPLENDLYTVGRIMKSLHDSVFILVYKISPVKNADEINIDELYKEKDILMTWCYDTVIKKNIWPIIGNIPVEPDFKMPYFSTDDGLGNYHLIRDDGDPDFVRPPLIKVSKEESLKYYSYGVSNEYALPKKCLYLYKKFNMF